MPSRSATHGRFLGLFSWKLHHIALIEHELNIILTHYIFFYRHVWGIFGLISKQLHTNNTVSISTTMVVEPNSGYVEQANQKKKLSNCVPPLPATLLSLGRPCFFFSLLVAQACYHPLCSCRPLVCFPLCKTLAIYHPC